MRTATKTALWLFSVTWYVWPVRYFFYYRYISCAPTDAIQGCIHTVGVSNTCNSNVEQLFDTNNVFYINMLGQGALLMICCNIAYLLTMLKALNIPHSAARDAKKAQDSTYKTGEYVSFLVVSLAMKVFCIVFFCCIISCRTDVYVCDGTALLCAQYY